ncbi:hypothetical protein M0R89_06505 [Halorussus limi]|uniref:Uncharacterized protein n=1 Tax=Halorussus limi TaxID=2938695 RepID=A0A8U0HYD2_9EURY|nr:hypothetical protein [Halorussus limi]UPV75711.1 hypothetical protein M0R89_06505 [Halorussus limi]
MEGKADGAADGEVAGPDVNPGRHGYRQRLSRIHELVFLSGNRLLLAGVLLVPFFGVVAALELYAGVTSQRLVPLYYVLSGIIGGNFTLLTIVISINQLVISRQLSAPGELRTQIEDTIAYREASSELVEERVLPPTPAMFLSVLLGGVRDSIRDLEAHRSDVDSDAADAIDEVLDPLKEQIRRSKLKLEAEDTTTFEALVVSLNTNYSNDIYHISRLQTEYGDELTSDVEDCLERLVTGLEQIDVARQYLKTVYIQAELPRLSRNLMYIGLPVIFTAMGLLEMFISTPHPVLSASQLSALTLVFVTASAAPLAVLFAYVLRLSVVSERTAAITPFTTPTQEATPFEAITEDTDD